MVVVNQRALPSQRESFTLLFFVNFETQYGRRMSSYRSTVRNIAEIVKARYVFPGTAERVRDYLIARSEAGVYDALGADKVAAQLTDDLRSASNDLHLRVRYSTVPHKPETPGEIVREQNDRAEHCRNVGYGIGPVQRTASGIAVLGIGELVEPALSSTAYRSALESVADAKALVIDLRHCVGGDPSTVALVCSHLFDTPIQLSSIVPRAAPEEHFWAEPSLYNLRFGGRKPLFVLVAKFTFSGAEMLAYDLQAAGRATVIGTVTGGGANPCVFHWPTPHFSLLLPEASTVSPITATNWEGRGVVPDLACPESEALRVALALADQHEGNA